VRPPTYSVDYEKRRQLSDRSASPRVRSMGVLGWRVTHRHGWTVRAIPRGGEPETADTSGRRCVSHRPVSHCPVSHCPVSHRPVSLPEMLQRPVLQSRSTRPNDPLYRDLLNCPSCGCCVCWPRTRARTRGQSRLPGRIRAYPVVLASAGRAGTPTLHFGQRSG
jgi:hypothetical protein